MLTTSGRFDGILRLFDWGYLKLEFMTSWSTTKDKQCVASACCSSQARLTSSAYHMNDSHVGEIIFLGAEGSQASFTDNRKTNRGPGCDPPPTGRIYAA